MRAWVFWVWSVLVLFKIYLVAVFPVIGDEAYYFYWGMHPAGGYYDLSPMIGWWEAFFTSVSLNPLWLRLPNLLVMLLVTFGIYEWLRSEVDSKRAAWVAALYAFAPVHFLGVLIAPDVPLLFFSFFSSFLFYRAMRSRSFVQSVVRLFFSGVLWGGAFSSKYFAVLLVLPVLAWLFVFNQEKNLWNSFFRKLLAVCVVALGALPFIFQHLWWNAQNCWANFVFNLMTRQQVIDGTRAETIGLYLLYLLILFTPFLIKDLFSKTAPQADDFDSSAQIELKSFQNFLLLFWLIPILVFGLTALNRKGQGLHWYLSYLPFFFMWVGLKLSDEVLLRRVRQVSVMTASLSCLVFVFLQAPEPILHFFLKGKHEQDLKIVLSQKHFDEMLKPWIQKVNLVVADNYSLASVLNYQLGKAAPEVYVWGSGSRFGRVYDWTSHFEKYHDQTVLLVARGAWANSEWDRYFREVKSEWVSFEGLKYWLSIGYGFKDQLYREEVLRPAERKYEGGFFPTLLPQKCDLLSE